MTFKYPDALASINVSFFTDGSKTYTVTKEADFLINAINVFTCISNSSHHTGTTRILDSLVENCGYRETVRFLYLIIKIQYSDLNTNTNYAYFWDWFKNCHENLSVFKREVEERAAKIDASTFASVIPESIRREFGE